MIVYFDLETTGPDPYFDRIVEIALVGYPEELLLHSRVNPGIPIPAAATEVHGITDADVAQAPPFRELAHRVQGIVALQVLCGYNCIRFDTPLLHRELQMAGEAGLTCDDQGRIVHGEIDLYQLWMRSEPRNLETALRRFAQVWAGGADHSALGDTTGLPYVLEGMAHEFGLDCGTDSLRALSKPEGAVDREGKFIRDESGRVVFGFGKHKGRPVQEQPGFLEWMLGRDFSPEVKSYAEDFLAEIVPSHY